MNNDQRPSVVILVGLPATGKSTARRRAVEIGAAQDSYQYSTDDKIDAYAESQGMSYSEAFADYSRTAHKQADHEVAEAIAAGQNVLWDQTNMSAKKRRKIMNRFPQEYRRECICILPPMNQEQEDELQRRLDSRPGKKIPDQVLRNMRDSFDLPSMNEGFNRVLYFDIHGNMVDRNDAADLFGKS